MAIRFKDNKLQIETIEDAKTIFNNGGIVVTDEGDLVRVKIKDMIEKYDSAAWLTKTVETIVREAFQPKLIIKSLFQRINTDANVKVTIVKQKSAADIGSLDVAEGQEYPTLKLDEAGGYVTVNTTKSGIQFIITDEMKEASQYDIIKMHIEQATYVLARHLEKKALDLLLSMGTVTHDNDTPANSLFGTTTGRDINGNPNGTVTVDDIVEAYSALMTAGYTPDIIIVSPLTWAMWMKDPVLKYFALTARGPMYNLPSGSVSPMWEGGMGPTGYGDPGNPPATGKDLLPGFELSPNIPSYFPFPIRVLVTPFMPINVAGTRKVTDIVVADSRHIGANVVEKDVRIDQHVDWKIDSTVVKIYTKQGFAIYDEGKGIAVIKNVVLADNAYTVSPLLQPTKEISGNIEIDRTTEIF